MNFVRSTCLRRFLSDRSEDSYVKIRCSGAMHFFVNGLIFFIIFHLSSSNSLVENALSVNLSIHLQTDRYYTYGNFANFQSSFDRFRAVFSGMCILEVIREYAMSLLGLFFGQLSASLEKDFQISAGIRQHLAECRHPAMIG